MRNFVRQRDATNRASPLRAVREAQQSWRSKGPSVQVEQNGTIPFQNGTTTRSISARTKQHPTAPKGEIPKWCRTVRKSAVQCQAVQLSARNCSEKVHEKTLQKH